MNLPNWLTTLRIFLVPPLVVVLLTEFEGSEPIALSIFLLAAITDWFDGYLARKRNQITLLGKFLDPIADKLLIASVFISLVEMNVVPAWMVVIIIGREIAVTGFRAIAASHGHNIPAGLSGKIKMAIEVITITLLIGRKYLGPFIFLSRIALWITLVVAILSAVDYYLKFGRIFLLRKT
ncbi:CDP-diacylglycerol--glycerol-3-phosphate 3-phosphatidyltransferase [Candidatus Aminicenantes bacterium AH-873-B07]|jgi:CDP-diacylglycerol--glycerol-3-phosphate 3-phosphatidyltransferase|nr:CDP-diacylglycerol--glycerol-3-phosphate 3-phosphatidyltransferase [Candidatus Aminicenantes bacterium AH-873-B07]